MVDGLATEPQVVASAKPEDIAPSHAQVCLFGGNCQIAPTVDPQALVRV